MKNYKNVDEYIKKAPKEIQDKLKEVRKIVLSVVKNAEEEIAYGMPAYKWNGKPLFYFAGQKSHLGIYPTSGPIVACKDILKDYSTSKGFVRLSYKDKAPKGIIVKLLKTRIKEIKDGITKNNSFRC